MLFVCFMANAFTISNVYHSLTIMIIVSRLVPRKDTFVIELVNL